MSVLKQRTVNKPGLYILFNYKKAGWLLHVSCKLLDLAGRGNVKEVSSGQHGLSMQGFIFHKD